MMLKFGAAQRQLVAAFAACISCFTVGTAIGWAAPTLKKLREPDAPFHLTPSEEAMVVNALYFTTIVSPIPCGVLMNRVGRKTALLVLSVSPIASWVLIYFSNSGTMLFLARLLTGIWFGASQTIVPIYVAEIAEPQVRGIVGGFFMVNAFSGTIFVYLIGPYVSIQTMALIGGVIPPIFFALFSLCPESPYYYVMRGRHGAAAEALAWLRGGAPIDTELTTIQTSIEKEAQAGQSYFGKLLNFITVPANRKAFAIVQTMAFLQRFSGITCMMAFSTVLLPKHLGPLTNDHCTLIIGISWLLSSILNSFLNDRLGRKPLLYMSSIGIFVSMLPTAAWYYLDSETSTDVSGYNWVPFAGFLLFGVTFSTGLGSIAPAYTGEMFPSNLKGPASALTTMNSNGTSAISTAIFVALNEHVGVYSNFLMFGAVGPLNLIFTYFCVVETKGKTLQMIQAELEGVIPEKTVAKGGA